MSLTPMMQQYLALKDQAQGMLLLFRMGDFYELFFEDAQQASRVLGLTLTSREKGENAIPMAGFPHHALDSYLNKLLQAGLRVAICEQTEDPKQAVGLVKRDISRVVTPGTLTDDSLLDPRRRNHLSAIHVPGGRKDRVGLAWIDLSAGTLWLAEVKTSQVGEELARIEPAELLVVDESTALDAVRHFRVGVVTPRPSWTFQRRDSLERLTAHFRVASFAGFGIDDQSESLCAAGALLTYLYETQKTNLEHVARLAPYDRGTVMLLDPVTRRSLEVTRTLRENRREGSLLDTIDRTVTAGGARLLADWLTQPLLDRGAITARHQAVEEWRDDAIARQELRDVLSKTFDVERLTSRVSTGRCTPRDLASLRQTLRWLPAIKARLAGRNASLNADLESRVDLFASLRADLETWLVDEPPLAVRDGGIIRAGAHAELDELVDIARGGKEWIAQFQRTEAERTGIANLKVGFNKVFGYYLEVTNSGRAKVPDSYRRKQTLKNAERYITPELKEYEEKVLGAVERSRALEYELFQELRSRVAQQTESLQRLAGGLAALDVLLALAELAARQNYVRPVLTADNELIIVAGRHPVLDIRMPAGQFVPNDCRLGTQDGRVLLITGPNMAGKSTYIRQVALIALLAQMGSFVPASSATIGLVDRIFTRVGASDELGQGQSTFMVEMLETANILNNATARSLVILDEIGRGTSTYDGISLAWAIAEFLHDQARCRTLFATHYHELIQLAQSLPELRNRNVAVREWQGDVLFLHQIVDGGADRSYGLHVARLAGVPIPVLERAQQVLEHLERDPFGERAGERLEERSGVPTKHRRLYHQLTLFPLATAHPILDKLRGLDLAGLDPAEALTRLRQWQRELIEGSID